MMLVSDAKFRLSMTIESIMIVHKQEAIQNHGVTTYVVEESGIIAHNATVHSEIIFLLCLEIIKSCL